MSFMTKTSCLGSVYSRVFCDILLSRTKELEINTGICQSG